MQPGISVVIPTFNRASTVIHAIDSVLNQAYPAEACELIVVDDGSSDATAELLTARYDSRIRLLRQRNQGPSAARNHGIAAARHDLIGFLDSDDQWHPNKLQRQVPIMAMPDVVLSYTNWTQRGHSRPADRFGQIGVPTDQALTVLDMPLEWLVRQNGSGIWTSTCIARKDVWRRCGGFDERMRLCEDIRLWFRMAFEGKFAVLAEPLVERGEPGTDNLCHTVDPVVDPAYARESARLRLELFWETYARLGHGPSIVATSLRRFIATSLYEQSMCHALAGEYGTARRKAIEALAFVPLGSATARILGSAVAPSVMNRLYRWKRSLRANPRSDTKRSIADPGLRP